MTAEFAGLLIQTVILITVLTHLFISLRNSRKTDQVYEIINSLSDKRAGSPQKTQKDTEVEFGMREVSTPAL